MIIRRNIFTRLYTFSVRQKRAQTLKKLEKEGVYEQVSQETIHLDRLSMTPHHYWIAKGRGMERPYTGEYWFNQEVGHYECRVCRNKLFSFDDKFKSNTGYASFWNHRQNSLELNEKSDEEVGESRHVCCAQCKCQLGKVFFDGPPPTFIRYQINSAAIEFILKPFSDDPVDIQKRKEENKERERLEKRRDFVKEREEDIERKQ